MGNFKEGDIVSASQIITSNRGHTGEKLRIRDQKISGCVIVYIERNNQKLVECGRFDWRKFDSIATLRKHCEHCGWQTFKSPTTSLELEIEMDDSDYN
jgi:hypothetical protein